MKRQCTDTAAMFTDTTSAVSATDNHQFLHSDLPYNSDPLPLTFPDAHITNPSHIQADVTPNNNLYQTDGATIETQRRPRGRPPGSKNKPKSPNPNPTRLNQPDPNNQPNHKHQILEIPNGADVIQAIAKHAVLNNTSLRILHTSGSVADVTLRLPNHHQPIVNFGGRHVVVSLSAVYIHPSSFSGQSQQQMNPIEAFNDVAITMSFEKGEIVGGFVVGPLIACGSVYVLVESISDLTYQRLDALEINANTASSGGGHQSPSADNVLNVPPMYSNPSYMPY